MIRPSQFSSPWWARNPHVQTILAKYLHRTGLRYRKQRLELPDGDFVDLAWGLPELDPGRPLVVLFHGLEGCIDSHYARGMMAALHARGWQPVLMHFRGCSGEPNRYLQAYHSGAIEDPHYLLQLLRRRFPDRPMAAIGYSLGGNMLINYLAAHPRNPLCAAAVISAPLQLAACAERINRGLSRLYQGYLLNRMKYNWQQRLSRHPGHPWQGQLAAIRSLRQFDDQITAPVHGFKDADDYYQRCSGLYKLARVATPTLVIHAADDPFMSDAVIPDAALLPPMVHYELSRHGGHVGFMQGPPWRPRYWLEQRIPDWLERHWPPY
ncbi:hydrolase [Zobellella endophytica]|uniref:Hydrolase n=1 Tax=Zobellella endophytica TaxID=2116700 RepID=A0A2P7R1F0_9GAMM|nr:hydrolase [Zobellella endophytica]PSJ44029.1 hydrolase [Zobellella endophytica]